MARNKVLVLSSPLQQTYISFSLIIICLSMNFASLNCKASTRGGGGKSLCTHSALPICFQSWTLKLDMLSGISTQEQARILLWLGVLSFRDGVSRWFGLACFFVVCLGLCFFAYLLVFLSLGFFW